MVRYGADLPVDVIEANIASALALVVQTQRLPNGRRLLSEIVSFSYDRERGRCIPNEIYRRLAGRGRGSWSMVPDWVDSLPINGIASREEVESWKACCLFKS